MLNKIGFTEIYNTCDREMSFVLNGLCEFYNEGDYDCAIISLWRAVTVLELAFNLGCIDCIEYRNIRSILMHLDTRLTMEKIDAK